MSIQSHLFALNDKHQKLESLIQVAYLNRSPDEQLAALKQERLHVKEQMELCRKQMRQLQEEAA